MRARLFLFIVFASACVFASAAETLFRIPITLSQVSADDPSKENTILAKPIVILREGTDASVAVGDVQFSLWPTLENENTARITLWLTSPHDHGAQSVLVKLGQSVTARIGEYAVEFTPALFNRGISIDFPGGTLAQLIAQLSADGKKPFNLVGASLDPKLPVPAFSVRNANPNDFAAALSTLLSSQGIAVNALASDSAFDPIYVVKTTEKNSEHSEFGCRDLTPLLERQSGGTGSVRRKPYTVDEIVDILQMACQFKSGPAAANDLHIQFHEGTKLLFLTGSADVVHTALVTLDALPKPEKLF